MQREEVDVQIAELEARLERLRVLYEQYFMGIERIEPGVARKDVERRVAELRRLRFHSTAQRFKFQTIVQRYNTMQQHWNRVCREIELGTYRRHKLKAERSYALREAEEISQQAKLQKNAQDGGRAATAREATEQDLQQLLSANAHTDQAMKKTLEGLASLPDSLPERGDGSLLSRLKSKKGTEASLSPGLATSHPLKVELKPLPPLAAVPRRSGMPLAPARPTEVHTPAGVLSESRVRALHQAYIDARQRTNARTVSFEKMERSLRETEAKLRESHRGKKVDFDVLVRNGKAILKPRLG